MSGQIEQLSNRRPGEVVTIYPHGGIALLQIAKVWTILGLFIGGYLAANHMLPQEVDKMLRFGCMGLAAGGMLFAAHRFLHYSNTYVQFTDDAIIYRKGWIPHSSDTIFWINIKDINTGATISESMLSSGTIILVVAIRTAVGVVKINFLPQHELIAEYIRQKIGSFNDGVRQVSYT